MGFDDLKIRLGLAFSRGAPQADPAVKARLARLVQARFKAGFERPRWLHQLRRYFARVLSVSAMSALLLGTTGVVELPLLANQVVGQVSSQSGVVEIIRGDESLLVSGSEALQIGDWVRVGHRGQAYITTDHFASSVESGSWLKVERPNRLYLDKGRLHSTHWRSASVNTDRGSVQSGGGGEVAIEVTGSGETHVLPSRNKVAIYDLKDGRLLAEAGEKVVLRSDTTLTADNRLPDDLELSNAQIEAIMGKLVIARTKALTGIENLLLGQRDRAHNEIMSAEKSFRSVVQILDSARDLSIARRVNLESVAVQDVYPALRGRTVRTDVLTEAFALEQLFAVLAQNRNAIAFAPVDTGVEAYDRYVLLHHLASVATPEQAPALYVLADNYVISVLRKVQQSPIKIEQLAYLNQQVDALPLNDDTQRFLTTLADHLSPDLATALEEKVNFLF